MVRSRSCDSSSLKKRPWTAEEDEKLLAYIQENGHGIWRFLPSKAGLQRCGKSCRLRWTNYLRPDIKRGKFSLQEEQTIIQLHALLGNRWSAIATRLPKRTDNEIKNYWNTRLKKRLTKMGIDPITHKRNNLSLNLDQSKKIANLSHMVQWESARVQAETRLVRQSRFTSDPRHLLAAAAPPPSLPRPPCLDILKVWEGTNAFSSSYGESMLPTPAAGFFNSGEPTVGNPSGNYQNESRGTMENFVGQDSLRFPSFIDGFADISLGAGTSDNALGGCWGVLEEVNLCFEDYFELNR